MTLYPAKTSAPKAYGRSFVVAHATGTAGFSISGGCRKARRNDVDSVLTAAARL